jgi:hypothetical protein
MCHMRRRMHLSFEDTCGFRSTWYLCPPYHCPPTRRVGVGESLLGPCSLLMGALDASKNIRTSLPPLHPSPSLSIPLHPSPSLSISLSLSLWCSLCVFGASRIHRCRNATRSAVHESGATPSLTTARHLLSTPHISLCRPLVRLPPNAAFFEAIFW